MFIYLLRETQFHGGRRLANEHFRNWWRLSLLIFFVLSISVSYVTIQRYHSNPTYMVREENVTPRKLFPTVTLCPEILFQNWKVEAFLANMKIPPNLNTSYIKSKIDQISAFFADVEYDANDLENLEHFLEYNHMSVDTAAQLLISSCEETLIRCRWRSLSYNCARLFRMELTGDGYCCVFNGQSLKRRSSHEDEYATTFTGFVSGLMLAVNQSQKHIDVDFSYKWIALQSPQHFVEPTINGTPLNPGAEHWVSLLVRKIKIGEDASALSENLKRCRNRSVQLKYFPIYHRRYCLVECEMRRTIESCNCVRHIHPRPIGIKYCSAQSLLCAKSTTVPYENKECECPSACEITQNHITTFSFALVPSSSILDSFYEGLDLSKVSIVRAYSQDLIESSNMRWSYYSNIDLFAQLGGVYNMFFGCSILTLLEVLILGIYYLRRKDRKVTQDTEHEENAQNLKRIEKSDEKNKKKHDLNSLETHKY